MSIEEKIRELEEKRNKLISRLKNIDKEIIKYRDQLFELSDKYVKIVCPECNGEGYKKDKEGRKHICPLCNGKKWIWALSYKE